MAELGRSRGVAAGGQEQPNVITAASRNPGLPGSWTRNEASSATPSPAWPPVQERLGDTWALLLTYVLAHLVPETSLQAH